MDKFSEKYFFSKDELVIWAITFTLSISLTIIGLIVDNWTLIGSVLRFSLTILAFFIATFIAKYLKRSSFIIKTAHDERTDKISRRTKIHGLYLLLIFQCLMVFLDQYLEWNMDTYTFFVCGLIVFIISSGISRVIQDYIG